MLGIVLIMVVMAVFVLSFLLLMLFCYRKIKPGKAIIRTGFGGLMVDYDNGLFAFPLFHQVQEIDISLQALELHCIGIDSPISKDGIAIDARVCFYLQINKSKDDILYVAQTFGCERASDPEVLRNLFYAKFVEVLKLVAKEFIFVELKEKHDKFKVEVLKNIHQQLHGFEIEDFAVKSILEAKNT